MLSYLIGATALANPTRWITDAGTALAALPERGEDVLYPGVVGETPLDWVRDVAYDEFEMRVSGLIHADGSAPTNEPAAFLTNLTALQSLLRPGGTISVTKTLDLESGPVVYGPSECRCVSDLSPRMEAPWTGLVLVRLKVYDGWGA